MYLPSFLSMHSAGMQNTLYSSMLTINIYSHEKSIFLLWQIVKSRLLINEKEIFLSVTILNLVTTKDYDSVVHSKLFFVCLWFHTSSIIKIRNYSAIARIPLLIDKWRKLLQDVTGLSHKCEEFNAKDSWYHIVNSHSSSMWCLYLSAVCLCSVIGYLEWLRPMNSFRHLHQIVLTCWMRKMNGCLHHLTTHLSSVIVSA